jgi:hypothetical protein
MNHLTVTECRENNEVQYSVCVLVILRSFSRSTPLDMTMIIIC